LRRSAIKHNTEARPVEQPGGLFSFGHKTLQQSDLPFPVALTALALHGHKKAKEAAHLFGWSVGAAQLHK
jgi:hypothetical protein